MKNINKAILKAERKLAKLKAKKNLKKVKLDLVCSESNGYIYEYMVKQNVFYEGSCECASKIKVELKDFRKREIPKIIEIII